MPLSPSHTAINNIIKTNSMAIVNSNKKRLGSSFYVANSISFMKGTMPLLGRTNANSTIN